MRRPALLVMVVCDNRSVAWSDGWTIASNSTGWTLSRLTEINDDDTVAEDGLDARRR